MASSWEEGQKSKLVPKQTSGYRGRATEDKDQCENHVLVQTLLVLRLFKPIKQLFANVIRSSDSGRNEALVRRRRVEERRRSRFSSDNVAIFHHK